MDEPYVFQEFPKWVTPEGGEPVLVQTAEEEAALLGTAEKPRRGRPPKAKE